MRMQRDSSWHAESVSLIEPLETRTLMAGDVVLEWNTIALETTKTLPGPQITPPRLTRAMAMVHGAVFDAVNSVERGYEPYLVKVGTPRWASPEAAAAVAAHDVLVGLFPAKQAEFDAALTTSLAAVPDGRAEDAGAAAGHVAAAAMLAARKDDGIDVAVPYTPGSDPDDWQPTPPAFGPALLPQFAKLPPFALTSPDQFRAAPPPSVTSDAFTQAFDEIKAVGAANSATRTAESGFEIRRMKFGFDGNVFSPNLTYLFLWATDRNTGNPVLEEAWAKYAFQTGALKNFYIKGGQFKDPFVHEALTSSKKLLAVERSLIDDVFVGGDDFVQGVSVGWDDGPEGSPFRAEVAYTDGVNGSNQNFQDFPTTKANFGVSGRVEYLAFGKWSEYEDFSAMGNTTDMLVIGAGANLTEAGDNDTFLHTVDVQWETGRLGVYGAYLGRTNEDLKVGTANVNTYDWGFIVQAAYMLDTHLEPFVRYDYINFDQKGVGAGVENRVSEITAGANYYFRGHNAKFTLDVSFLPEGTPVADTGSDVLSNPGQAEFLLRAQFQLLL